MAVPAASADPGNVDVSFGVDGSLRSNFGGTYDWAYATAVQPDGRILAAGVSNARGTYDFALARYTSTHDLDPSFGNHGVVLTDFGRSYDWAYALALQPDGKIVVAGVSDASGSKDFALARYNPDGTLDPKFGRGGLVTLSIRSLTTDIIRGIGSLADGGHTTGERRGDLLLARVRTDGSLDGRFGNNNGKGFSVTDLGTNSERISSLVLQPNGKIVAGGQTAVANNADFAVFRYD